jgi:hypothetical protein
MEATRAGRDTPAPTMEWWVERWWGVWWWGV